MSDTAKASDVLAGTAQWSAEAADCLPWMASLPPACVDMVVTSPPYELARLYLEGGKNIGIARKTEAWVAWMLEVVKASLRICKGLVVIVCEGQTKNFCYSGAPVLLWADMIRAGITTRKAPIFRRIGIPGSGGPDWWRNDYEFCLCATNGGKLPWSDNTATGHVPKWAPGGEMSHRLADGQRVNQFGGREGNMPRGRDSNQWREDHTGLVFTEVGAEESPPAGKGKRPSHIIVDGRDQSGGTPHRSGGEGRKANGEHKGGNLFGEGDDSPAVAPQKNAYGVRTDTAIDTRQTGNKDGEVETYRANDKRRLERGNEKGSCKGRRVTRGHADGDTQTSDSYEPPVLANPGNTPQQTYTALEVAAIIEQYERGDILDCKVGGGLMGHPLASENEAPFPESLVEPFVRCFCPEGGVVLDSFAGSGTTIDTAIKWGRRAIGCDLRQSQIEIIRRRMQGTATLFDAAPA